MAKLFSFENEEILDIEDSKLLRDDEQFNDYEISYLNNIEVSPVDEVAFEGYFRALGGYMAGDVPDTYTDR